MNRYASGHYDTTATGGETVRAFVPFPLPPDPPLDLSGNRQRLLECATLALGRLDTHNARFQTLMDQHLPKWRSHRDTPTPLPVRHERWGY